MRAIKECAQLCQALLVLDRASAGDSEEPGYLRGLSTQRQKFLGWAPVLTLPAVPAPAMPGTTKPASETKWAARTLPTAWTAKPTSETKWAARALSLTGHPGRRPSFPVSFLGEGAGLSVKFTKHCSASPFN